MNIDLFSVLAAVALFVAGITYATFYMIRISFRDVYKSIHGNENLKGYDNKSITTITVSITCFVPVVVWLACKMYRVI